MHIMGKIRPSDQSAARPSQNSATLLVEEEFKASI